jgi:hypothetical protein
MYAERPSRAYPACLILLIDQSASMADTFGGDNLVRKAEFVANAVNHTIYDLVVRCTKTEEVRNYYYLSVIGYGGSVGPAFAGQLTGRTLVPIAEVADLPARVEMRSRRVADSAGTLFDTHVRFPVWIEPRATGNTPMCEAFAQARNIIKEWLSERPRGFPPTVLNLTDGESTDGDPTQLGREIMSLRTNDGPVLLFNCHASSRRSFTIEYPDDDARLPDDFARLLFNISSPLPDPFRRVAGHMGLRLSEGARGFVFNADPTAIVQFVEIGTSTTPASYQPHMWMDER